MVDCSFNEIVNCPSKDSAALSDRELVELSRKGDTDAFGELISRHYRKCAMIAASILRDRASASDEVQNACWKAFEHLDQYRGDAEFSAWLSRIVMNECRMLLRAGRRVMIEHLDANESVGELDLAAVAFDPELDLITRQMADVVRREVRHLPTLMRNVVTLRDVENLPMEEVALRLGVSVAAVKSRLERARREVRARVREHVGTWRDARSSVCNLPAKSARANVAW